MHTAAPRRHAEYLGVLLLFTALSTSTFVNAACNISMCFDDSGFAVPLYSTNTTNYSAIQPYYDCMVRAGSVRAFQCRCSLKLRDCCLDPLGGNCTDVQMRVPCQQMLVLQGLGCNPVLCQVNGASSVAVASLVKIVVAIGLMIVVVYSL